eukprot:TRINITY_DN19090_c0_g1_i1.p2 TRINITY_DN19090_c0_g1~~TRINITY_DN19090_c0_g1_i1.p2  ORF type:complete len:141 (-),score=34.55 TRINITY_DN19090_c0_g1_i1:278-700(-)
MLLQVAIEDKKELVYQESCPPVYLPVSEIKVIGAGLGHSGSTSFECALAELGFHPAAPRAMLCRESAGQAIWYDWAKGGSFQPCLQQLLQLGFDATTPDQPTGFAGRELMALFPEAKVVQVVCTQQESRASSTRLSSGIT